MTNKNGRTLGQMFSDEVIYDPYPDTSAIIYGATGAAKTTSVVVPAVQSLLSTITLAQIINDVKSGEIAAQIANMCLKYDRKFGMLDDFLEAGTDNPHRLSLNPFGSIVSAFKNAPSDLLYAIETAVHALIPQPQNNSKDQYFRDIPREEEDLGIRILLGHKPELATPGASIP